MSTYVIGDVQGCLSALKALLQKINYDAHRDQLWFTGDLANRGEAPLETLRFIRSLPNTVCVLGNHDIALLAAKAGAISFPPHEKAQEILDAPDATSLLDWLRHLPLLHHDPHLNVVMTHAGIYPFWDLMEAKQYAIEAETHLHRSHSLSFFRDLFGNTPTVWNKSLEGMDRTRFIVNVFTRMRYLTKDGLLDFDAKNSPSTEDELIPWFSVPNRKSLENELVFGHFAALKGQCDVPSLYALDEGCVWGGCLAALCLETKQRFNVKCDSKSLPQ